MPDKDGKLSKEEMAKAIDWLKEKSFSEICPMCKKSDFIVNDHIMSLYSGGLATFPALLVHCSNCSSTSMFSAVYMGIVPKDDEGDSDERDK